MYNNVFPPGDCYLYNGTEGGRPTRLQKIRHAWKSTSETNPNHGTTLLQCGEQGAKEGHQD